MIFKKLQIKNFGIYQGQHSIDFQGKSDKPIVLIGALNGGGKTTFLDAIQLALYGKHAKCSNRAGTPYGTFLANCKNHFASQTSNVSISLVFTHKTEKQNNTYEIERSWQAKGYDTKDKIKVYVNSELDEHLSLHWDEFVNEFIPLSLSDLFFFDGEKIENLADPLRSSELIKTGIESLLGLDLLSQLQIDLSSIHKKKLRSNIDEKIIKKVEDYESEINQYNLLISKLKKESADLEQKANDMLIDINKARQAAHNAGAHLIEDRDKLKFELGSIEAQIKLNKTEQIKLAAGVRPLALVSDLIEETKKQISLESEINQAKILDTAISSYNRIILNELKELSVSCNIIESLDKSMKEKTKSRQKLSTMECYLNSNLNIFSGLSERIIKENEHYHQLKLKEKILIEKASFLEKKLSTIPNNNSVQHLIAELKKCEDLYADLKDQYKEKKEQLANSEEKLNILSLRYSNLLTIQNKESFEQKRTLQISEHITVLKNLMAGFSEKLIRENIENLEFLVKQKFETLTRKSHLINKLKICPTSFAITLYDIQCNKLAPSKLSAGERQLLAIAILWGLAEASGKELPTIIDTPLSRLDGQHRNNLIDNYFPNAGHQVILLSTDEEIIGNYYKKLKPYVAQELTIRYSEEEKTSRFTEGYF